MSKLQIQDNIYATKVKHLTDALYDAINQGKYATGQALPSVNQISRQYNLSRDTVFKAYRELKKRGIVDSTPAKGYHVAGMMNKILLMLDIYSPFKDVLYNSFVSRLPKSFKVDLVFHFYNEHLFETVISDSIGRYNYYVIMNFSNEVLHESLRKIDPARLLILDLGDFEKYDYAFICQDFGRSVQDCLGKNIALLRKYNRFVLYLPDDSEHPKILIKYFKRFARTHNLEAEVAKAAGKLKPYRNTAYLVIQQKDLVNLVKQCRTDGLTLGKDVGLIAYNDTPMYEIIEKGITVISTDFAAMGYKAAEFVKTREKVQEVIPARMIVRGSL